MRTMSIPPFPKRIEIADFESFTNARLAGEFKLSQQASALAGYMFYPAKRRAQGIVRRCPALCSGSAPAKSEGNEPNKISVAARR